MERVPATNFKVGDIVSYGNGTRRRYGKITRMENGLVYALWGNAPGEWERGENVYSAYPENNQDLLLEKRGTCFKSKVL